MRQRTTLIPTRRGLGPAALLALRRRRAPAAALFVGALFSTATAARAAGQDPGVLQAADEDVRPGDGTVDGTRIEPYTNRWRFVRVRADGARDELGEWRDELRVVERDGRAVIERIQHAPAPGGRVRRMVNLVDRRTLAPIRTTFALVGDPPYLDVAFDGSGFRGVRGLRPQGAAAPLPARIDVDLDRPVFDWSLWGILVAGFPLREDYAARFVAFGPSPNGRLLLEVAFRVTGRESVDLGAERRADCWIVALEELQPWTLWIATERGGPPVVQIDIDLGEGVHLRWEPADAP